MDQAQATSLLQLPGPMLEKITPMLGMLNNMMDQAQAQSFLQTQGPIDEEDRLAKLGPILDKLKSLDPKTAAMLSKMVGGASFLQTSGPEMDPEEKMMKLDHVLEKLRSLDPKTFG